MSTVRFSTVQYAVLFILIALLAALLASGSLATLTGQVEEMFAAVSCTPYRPGVSVPDVCLYTW